MSFGTQLKKDIKNRTIIIAKLFLILILIVGIIVSGCLRKEEAKKPAISENASAVTPGIVPENMTGALSNVKVVVIYERIIGKRPVDDSINLLMKADPDFIFRGFFKMDSNWGYGQDKTLYTQLADAITKLKEKKPSILFEGAINAAYLDPADTWADGTPLSEDDINSMVVYVNGKPVTRDRPQLPKKIDYAADIANKKYRDFIVGWSEKQIDAGVDCLFYDEPFINLKYKAKTKQDLQATYEEQLPIYEDQYWKDIVDRVKSYAASKGKTVYITANQNYDSIMQLHPWKYLDFVTVQIQKEDLADTRVNENWDLLKQKVRTAHGKDVPIIVFMDWANDPKLALGLFAGMSTDNQNRFLELIDQATSKNGILFAYPMHGGEPGIPVKSSQFEGVYDSLDYGTYDNIVQLAKNKRLT